MDRVLNKNVSTVIRNFNYMFSSNMITFLVSTTIVVFVPKYFGITEYGYIQLYLFYSSYAGFLLLGWNDGVHLRFGGYDYKELNFEKISKINS